MLAAAPQNLERDVLEVTRGHHLLGVIPSETTQKALAAAQRLLEAKEARKKARQTRVRKTAAQAEADVDMDAEEQEDVSLVDAIGSALVEPVEEQREKIKVKTKVRRSALVPAGASRDMDLS
jgi:large subunit ribosomal protein L24e